MHNFLKRLGVVFFVAGVLVSVFILAGCSKSRNISKKNPVIKQEVEAQPNNQVAPEQKPVEQAQDTKPIEELIQEYKIDKISTEKQAAKKPRIASNFKLQDIYQDYYSLSDFKGKQPVLLFFWTTWCPFCQNEISILNNRYPTLVKDDLEVLAIDMGELPSTVNNFLSGTVLGYRVLLDMDASVAGSFKVLGVPTYILINKKGEIVFQDNDFPLEYKDLLVDKEVTQ